MALFIIYHKWAKENMKLVAKKVIEALAQVPEGACLVNSYLRADMTGAVCIWEAKSAEQVDKFLKKMVPEMQGEVVQALQFYPPAADVYKITHALIS
jgi:hypothetical protein